MTDSDDTKKEGGIERAPWDPPPKPTSHYPRQPGQPGAPQPQQGPPQGPPPGPPPGPQPQQNPYANAPQNPASPGAGNNFGESDLGRARTRSIPKQDAGTGTAPLGAGDKPAVGSQGGYIGSPGVNAPQTPQGYNAGGAPSAPQGYPQGGQQAPQGGQQGYPQGGPPPGPQAAPQQGYPQQGPQQPYGGQQQGYPAKKPTTVMGIISLVLIGVGVITAFASAGLFSFPFFLAGAILGYLGMRETTAWGKKSGRGLAVGGTIANTVLLVLNAGVVILLVMVFQTASDAVDEMEAGFSAQQDGQLLVQRVKLYHEHKGDLEPGGPQVPLGSPTNVAVQGQLKVSDLVSETELTNPIEQYSLTINGGVATIYWTSPKGVRQQVGVFDPEDPFAGTDWQVQPGSGSQFD